MSTCVPSLKPVCTRVFLALFSASRKTEAPAFSVTSASTGIRRASSLRSMPILTMAHPRPELQLGVWQFDFDQHGFAGLVERIGEASHFAFETSPWEPINGQLDRLISC